MGDRYVAGNCRLFAPLQPKNSSCLQSYLAAANHPRVQDVAKHTQNYDRHIVQGAPCHG